jgi:hypothetical protein
MTSVQVFGIKEALKELSALDPNLRKQINRDAKTIAKPATDGIKNAYPNKYLSGMSKPWVQRGRQLFPYDAALARKGVQLKIATGKKNVSVIGIEQKNPAAAIIDMAGKKGGTNTQGARFIASLTAMFGEPSRVMWPEYEKNGRDVERNMLTVVEHVMEATNRNLVM